MIPSLFDALLSAPNGNKI